MRKSKTTLIITPRVLPPVFVRICRKTAPVLLIVRAVTLVLLLFGVKFWFSSVVSGALVFFLYDIVLAASLVGCIRFPKRWLYVLPGILAAGILLVYGMNLAAYQKDVQTFVFESETDSRTLVAEERSYLFSGTTTFYSQAGPFLIKTGQTITRDDGYQMLRNAKKQVDFTEAGAFFSYVDDQGNVLESVIIE